MGWISMSERDLKRIEVLNDARADRRTGLFFAAVFTPSNTILLAGFATASMRLSPLSTAFGDNLNRQFHAVAAHPPTILSSKEIRPI
jgi:hypothetical protein